MIPVIHFEAPHPEAQNKRVNFHFLYTGSPFQIFLQQANNTIFNEDWCGEETQECINQKGT